ncbi:MAG: hypothetical protein K2Q18_07870 [Bdellovibrionales bacterium]|nr:hypothetical protein [Bdellovibrionales bacterium]
MKKFILLILASLTFTALAQDFAPEYLRPEGIYLYTGLETIQIRDVEVVPTQNVDRYKKLLQEKYECSLRGGFHMCQKHTKLTEIPSILHENITREWQGRFFEFTQTENTPIQTNDSEGLLEWDIYDHVKFEGAHIFEYQYYLLKGDSLVHKISLNFLSGKRWLVIRDAKTLLMSQQKTIRESQFKARIYELSLVFKASTRWNLL